MEMAKCKICGCSVIAGSVVHANCLEQQVTGVAEKVCDSYCKWPGICGSQEKLEDEHCYNCPIQQLMKLAE